MVKIVLLLGLGLGTTALTALSWVINSVYAAAKVMGVSLGPLSLPSWILYIITVDLSTVTTLVPAITSFCVLQGLWKVYQAQNKKRGGNKSEVVLHESFPFWRNYKTIYVQLGLLGTIFAFILAFSSFSVSSTGTTVSQAQMLLDSLGTALWSTFVAILVAFIVNPFFFEKLLFQRVIGVDRIFPSIDNNVDSDLLKTAEAVVKLREAIVSLTAEIGDLESVKKALGKLSNLENQLLNLRGQLEEFKIDQEKRLTEKIVEFENKFLEKGKRMEEMISSMMKRVDKLEEEKAEEKEKLDFMVSEIKELLEKIVRKEQKNGRKK